jgi:hypothetical protein
MLAPFFAPTGCSDTEKYSRGNLPGQALSENSWPVFTGATPLKLDSGQNDHGTLPCRRI